MSEDDKKCNCATCTMMAKGSSVDPEFRKKCQYVVHVTSVFYCNNKEDAQKLTLFLAETQAQISDISGCPSEAPEFTVLGRKPEVPAPAATDDAVPASQVKPVVFDKTLN